MWQQKTGIYSLLLEVCPASVDQALSSSSFFWWVVTVDCETDFFFLFFPFFILYTVHWVCPSPQSCVTANNSQKWVRSHGCISDGVVIVPLPVCLSRWIHSVCCLMNAKTNPRSQKQKVFPVWRSNSQDSRRSGWRQHVLLGNTWSSVNNPTCFLMSQVTHPTLNELLARSLGVLSQTGIYGSEERLSGFSFQKALRFSFFFFFFFLSNNGSPTLHSDQSFPGIPVRLCSKTGIDPRKQDGRKIKFVNFLLVLLKYTSTFNWLSEETHFAQFFTYFTLICRN